MNNFKVVNLGKRYFLPAPAGDAPESPLKKRSWSVGSWFGRRASARQRLEFWALRDVSFEVEGGTVLGVIGANGAGKSTLLKILARVTVPTEGHAAGVGRIVSLLELGAGFDPDLGARENIVMNAAMHGISRTEALERLPEILAFAELDQFVETPLKHYSTGMYLRLAFSAAINMNPRILLADEILAVGDAAFQERCLQKVEESGRAGLIVLFVSHDMEAITRVCNRVLWIHKGRVQAFGEPEEVVGEYQDAVWTDIDPSRFERGRQSSRFAAIRGVKLLSADGRETAAASTAEDVYISIGFEAFKTVSVKGAIDVHARRQFLFRTADTEFRRLPRPGMYELRVKVPAHLLTDITYDVTASVTTLREGQYREYRLVAYHALSFMAYNREGTTVSVKGRAPRTGLLAPHLEWQVEQQNVVLA